METTATGMLQLVRSFLGLVRLKLPPQAFPASNFLFLLTATVFLLVTFLYLSLAGYEMSFVAGRTALSFVNQLLGAWLILALFNKSRRWLQTSTALLGGDAIFAVLAMPLVSAGPLSESGVIVVLLLSLLVWQLVFFAHIYRHAVDCGFGAGMLLGVIYILVSSTIKQAILPMPAG